MNAKLLDSLESWLSQPIVELFGWSLVHFLWQGAVAALLVSVALFALRRASARTRYVAACAGLVLMAACLPATLFWTWHQAAESPAIAMNDSADASPNRPMTAPVSTQIVELQPARAPSVVAGPEIATPTTSAAPATQPGWPTTMRPLLPWLVAVWLVGVLALTARLCVGWLGIQRLRRRGVRPVADNWDAAFSRLRSRLGISRPVALFESALVEVPTLIGWLRPVILLPASALMGLAPRQLEAILAHELAHVRRHDYLVNLFQTALETLLFYHPAVWWVSRVIRSEREACCDEIAVETCGDRLEYARALTSLEGLRSLSPRLAVAAAGGPLTNRIRRLLGLPTHQSNRSAWWVMAAAAAGVLAMFAMQSSNGVQADQPAENAAKADAAADDWGPESKGLRCRLVAVPASADDESPDLKTAADQYATGDDVTLAVELKNVGDKPLTLMGIRYGDSSGQLGTGWFAPRLFEFEFTDAAGEPIGGPSRSHFASLLELNDASTHEIDPGKSLVVLLRPAQFNSPMEHRLPAGEYRARVRYRGPSEQTVAAIARHWPDKPQGKAWSGDAVSNGVSFKVAGDPAAQAPDLVWGETKDGLQAAVEFRRSRGNPSPDDPPGTIPLNTVVDVVMHFKNVSDKPISLVSETWRQDDQVTITNEAGEEQHVGGSWYTGLPIMVRWTLKPGDVAEIQSAPLGVAADQATIDLFEHPIGKSLIAMPGTYTVRYTIRFGNIQTSDAQGNAFPAKEDWQGELVAGDAKLVVRARTPEDDERERVETFTGLIEFVGPGGAPIESGTFVARVPSNRAESPTLAIHAGPIEVPECTAQPMSVHVRASGFEEAYHADVQLNPAEPVRIELKPAAPTTFRLVGSADGAPVAGATVRHFNKSCGKASAGPYPMQGLAGSIWTTSQADGTVLLDSLQRTDPHYPDLGDAVYYLYIESPGLAPRFLGPVKAGQDLGDVIVGPLLEVHGEIRGTAEELERFAAEWDQPFELTSDNPDAAWLYAISQKLETQPGVGTLKFHLTGLRPGKLRIIANFSPHPHQVSHTYTRRDPKGSDIVVEVDLTESMDDLVVTPAGRQ